MIQVSFPGSQPYPRFLSLWEPSGAPRGVLLVSHGMAEHIGRYQGVGEYLAAQGFLVGGYNHLGHGAEAPVKGWFADRDGWRQLVQDLRRAMDFLAARAPGAPRILLGHSMGSFLAREYAITYPDGLDALVLSGTGWHPKALCLLGLLPANVLCLLGKERKPSPFLDKLAFSANNKPFQEDGGAAFLWLSRDANEVKRYVDDPLCGFVFTAGGFSDLFQGLLALSDTGRLRSLPAGLPVYLMSGAEDPVGGRGQGVNTVAGQYRAAGLERVTVRLYEGARHELFNETNKSQVLSDLVAWLSSVLG